MPDYNLARKGIYVFYYTGDQYENLAEMERSEALESVRNMVNEDKRLLKEIKWYAQREEMDKEQAMSEVTERMYLSMTKQ